MASINRPAVCVTSEADNMGENTVPYGHHKPFIRRRHPSGSEDVHYSAVYDDFPEEFRLMAERELKETEEGRKRGLQKLKEYMASEKMTPLKDDLLLLAVLRNCKYSVKKSEVKLKNFLNTRRELIKMLKEVGIRTCEKIVDDMGFGMLPYRDKHGRVILYTRPNGVHMDHYSCYDVGLVLVTAALFSLSYPITTVSGFAYFGECESDSLHIFYHVFKAFRKTLFPLLSLPLRMSRVEILNENYLCKSFHRIVSPLVSKKLLSRVSLHGSNFEQFHQMYHPDTLPEVFGGNMGPLSNKAYREKLLDFIRDLINEKD